MSKGFAFHLLKGFAEASWRCQVAVIQHWQGVSFEAAVVFSKLGDWGLESDLMEVIFIVNMEWQREE